ncbi:hypothetical protein ISCGN_015205 [Ixodes scapularis]
MNLGGRSCFTESVEKISTRREPQSYARSVCPPEGPQQGSSGAFPSGQSAAVTAAVGESVLRRAPSKAQAELFPGGSAAVTTAVGEFGSPILFQGQLRLTYH